MGAAGACASPDVAGFHPIGLRPEPPEAYRTKALRQVGVVNCRSGNNLAPFFLFTRRLSGTCDLPAGGRAPDGMPPPHADRFPSCPVLIPHLSVERGSRPLACARGRERHLHSSSVPAVSPFPAVLSGRSGTRASHPVVALDMGPCR